MLGKQKFFEEKVVAFGRNGGTRSEQILNYDNQILTNLVLKQFLQVAMIDVESLVVVRKISGYNNSFHARVASEAQHLRQEFILTMLVGCDTSSD